MPSSFPTAEQITASVQKTKQFLQTRRNVSISARQKASLEDPGVRGPAWVCKTTLREPDHSGICDLVAKAISELGSGLEQYAKLSLADVPCEWVGHRPGAQARDPEPPQMAAMNPAEKYKAMKQVVMSKTVVLHCVGGAFYFNGPHTARHITARLSQLTEGRCLSIQPRLAPQYPFPAAVIDLLHAYLHLLYPIDGDLHESVAPARIVIAGDSSGACLSLALVQVVLATRRVQQTDLPVVNFNGRQVLLPMPAGVALVSTSGDQTLALPSFESNGPFDTFGGKMPALQPGFPTCDLWPSEPPRGQVFCEVSAVCHPLMSPTAATDWRSAPPMYFASGLAERLLDSAKVIARNAAQQGVVVRWDGFEMMPHTWPMLFKSWPQTEICCQRVARACIDFSAGDPGFSRSITIHIDGSETQNGTPDQLTDLDMAYVHKAMKAKQAEMKVFTGAESAKAKL